MTSNTQFDCSYQRTRCFAWGYLALAVMTEIVGLCAMQMATGRWQFGGYAVLYLCVALSYVFLAKAVRTIPIGIAYAVWEGSGIALITLVSAICFQQTLTVRELIGVSLAIVGIAMVNAGEVQETAAFET